MAICCASLQTHAAPASVNEGQSRQINAFDLLDDTSLLTTNASSISWSILNGPLTSISTGGLAIAAIVYSNSNANVQGSRGSFSSTLMLTVLNVNSDDFGTYAGDGIDDDWQVQYFGVNNPAGGPLVDPDRDGQSNLFEFVAGLVPNDAASRFALRVERSAGPPNQRRLIFSPVITGRTYTPLSRTSLSAGSWTPLLGTTQVDNGNERTVTDPNAGQPAKFYEVQISRP